MTSKKTEKPAAPKKTARKQEETKIYVGPSLSEGRLIHATVFIGGYPAHVAGLIADNPWLEQLFVPIPKLNDSLVETKQKGSLLNILCNKAKEV